ncbi:type II secretion system protein GspM [Acinetobacter larvae]|uniref:Type II secretion system protein M n=1 Tax=Acinetobacter larvae TaxID=1789224 RepID=A0A1B2LYS2_9GAMM|nr:type II secretion system protein GspM [Acinetobacter larvae]AOA58076.1 type II secretion system protein M [Acinetobacter larvae]
MKVIDQLKQRREQLLEKINDALDRLNPRERVLVIFTVIFALLSVIGWSIWQMHQLADQQQQRYDDLKKQIVSMQSQVLRMRTADDLALSAADKVQRAATEQGISVASQQQADKIMIEVTHENYAILANFLMQMTQHGLTIEQLSLNKQDMQIKLTATVY